MDGDKYNCRIANILYKNKDISIANYWLNLDNLSLAKKWVSDNANEGLGILSIDVDGNDYYFLESLISIKAAIIICEYNSVFGLAPISVPYDPSFDRRLKHSSCLYYGASLKALCFLASQHDYTLVEVGNTGINAFFLGNDLLSPHDIRLAPETSFREKLFPDGSRYPQQFEAISNMPFTDVTKEIR